MAQFVCKDWGFPVYSPIKWLTTSSVFLSSVKQKHLTGQLLRQSLEAMKSEIGCEGPMFTKSYEAFKWLVTPTWLPHLWEFMAANSMVIEDGVPDLMLEREGDMFLIREFQAAGYSGNSLEHLNLCRLFLHAVTVSDIATRCGCFIT